MKRHVPLLVLSFLSLSASNLWAQGPSSTPFLTAPPDVTIGCADGLHDPALTGSATFLHVGDVSYEDTRMDWDYCTGGMVERLFTATDGEGNTLAARQAITIQRTGDRYMTMPPHYCADCENDLKDLSPGGLPEGIGYPTVHGDGCGLDMYHEDKVALINKGKRVRIERLWTVSDPCTGLPPKKHLQVIGSELLPEDDVEKATPMAGTEVAPGRVELLQNRPNPFGSATAIGFVLPEESAIELKVQQADGRVVKVWEGTYPRGYNEVSFDRGGIAGQGVLFYTLTVGGHRITKRMVYAR